SDQVYDPLVPPKRLWVLLAYRLPREPSTPRIYLWRRLRQLGAVQVGEGLAALPFDERTREQLDWLAQYVEDHAGDASVWIAEPGTVRQGRELAAQMKAAVAADYRAVIEAADAVGDAPVGRRRQTVLRLRRSLERIQSRDFFPPPERRIAERAIADLHELVEAGR